MEWRRIWHSVVGHDFTNMETILRDTEIYTPCKSCSFVVSTRLKDPDEALASLNKHFPRTPDTAEISITGPIDGTGRINMREWLKWLSPIPWRRCPIGLDKSRSICSYSSCTVCTWQRIIWKLMGRI